MITKFVLILAFITATLTVDESATKIETIRNSRRESVCEYYSDNFTDS